MHDARRYPARPHDARHCAFRTCPPASRGSSDLAMNLWWSWSREARGAVPLHRRSRSGTSPATTRSSCSAGWIPPASRPAPATATSSAATTTSWRGWRTGRPAATPGSPHATPSSNGRPVAYFCAEFGLHNSVPIYSGGLGVLAGDHCKAASDLGVPMVGVGLFYMKGYFDQRLTARRLAGGQRRGVRRQPHAARAGDGREAGAVPHHRRDLGPAGARARLAHHGGPGAALPARHQPRGRTIPTTAR